MLFRSRSPGVKLCHTCCKAGWVCRSANTTFRLPRYFLAHIYQFQFHRAACQQAGWTGPLHRCSVYGQRDVGARFNAMMQMGQSHPWPDALEAFTGQRQTDATAVTAYFETLNAWLTEQNRGEQCGW